MNVKDIIWAFICVNLSIFIVESIGFLPVETPYYSPSKLLTTFSVPDSWEQLVIPGVGALGGFVAIILGYGLAGTALLFIAALSLFWQPAQWALGGIGQMLEWLNAPTIIVQVANVFSAFIWMVFIVEYLGGRRVE